MAQAARGEKNEIDNKLIEAIRLSRLLFDKCEIGEARRVLEEAYALAKSSRSNQERTRLTTEIVSGLLRIASEAQDKVKIAELDRVLEDLIVQNPGITPPMAWYCRGNLAMQAGHYRKAQAFFHKYLVSVRDNWDQAPEVLLNQTEAEARAYLVNAVIFESRGHTKRAEWLANQILAHPVFGKLTSIRGTLFMTLGRLAEHKGDFDQAMIHYQNAHTGYLASRNWLGHLYLLYAYARIARKQNRFAQAYWYLDLVDKACNTSDYGYLRQKITQERAKLQSDAVDLLVDCQKGVIRTREKPQISVRKQYVLLNILEALTDAHNRVDPEAPKGLSKAEIIERVWKEKYRPELHDNKLYYNINRLRKLIEPDVKQPQYLLNWREGYRLAPGLKTQVHLKD